MIYTVTFNPSLDYIVSVKDFRPGMTNRTSSELMLAGGKGINVSIVLGNLGIKSTALGFIAGFTGDEIVRRLHNGGINSEFIKINDGISRINIKLKSIDGTEINGQGPHIDSSHIEQLMNRLRRLESGDVLVLAGSIPAGISDNIYKDSIEYKLKNDSIELSLKAKSEFKIENDSISRDLKIELNKLKFKYYETNTVITKEVIKSPLISIGTQIGFGGQYGLFHKTLDVGPYFGIGVQLNFRFRK